MVCVSQLETETIENDELASSPLLSTSPPARCLSPLFLFFSFLSSLIGSRVFFSRHSSFDSQGLRGQPILYTTQCSHQIHNQFTSNHIKSQSIHIKSPQNQLNINSKVVFSKAFRSRPKFKKRPQNVPKSCPHPLQSLFLLNSSVPLNMIYE